MGVSYMQVIGAVIGGLVAIQLIVNLTGTVRRSRQQADAEARTLRLLDEQIRSAAALRVQREQTQLSWNGYRKFVVEKKVCEVKDVCSFYLVPHDQKPLPMFEPGQFLTFKLPVPGSDKPVIRCYSLSCSPNKLYYRVTIKRVPPPRDQPDAPPGVVSNYFHDLVHEGDILDVQAPRGQFKINPTLKKPLVLIGAGVGITPMLSMVGAIAESGTGREVTLFYCVRNKTEHAQKDYLESLSRNHPNIRIYACYSDPTSEDREHEDYQFGERISADLLKRVLDSNNYDYYICGPSGLMDSMTEQLVDWGVPKDRVFVEAFMPAAGKTVKKIAQEGDKPASAKPTETGITVKFSRSGKSTNWDAQCNSLLEFARKTGITMESGCEIGNCGTCLVAVRSGKVKHTGEGGADCEDGACLTCIAVPESDIVLDV